MITTAKNYDVICFQLRNNLYSQLESPLKKELNRLSVDITTLITSGKKIEGQSVQLLGQIFNLRVKAIKWLALDKSFNYREMFREVLPQIEELKVNKKLEVLSENLLFALRCNQRVVNAILGTSEISVDTISSTQRSFPEITYEQFIGSLSLAIPDDEVVEKIINWTNASLHIEFVMIAADIIYRKQTKISEKTINELAFLAADSAQEYIAHATALGILRSGASDQSFSSVFFDKKFINEQKQLSDLGLSDFVSKI